MAWKHIDDDLNKNEYEHYDYKKEASKLRRWAMKILDSWWWDTLDDLYKTIEIDSAIDRRDNEFNLKAQILRILWIND